MFQPGFESVNPLIERLKSIRFLDSAATMIGFLLLIETLIYSSQFIL
jgi:hypothetical protein